MTVSEGNGLLKLVIDTNVFVAAGFRRKSEAAALLARVRAGEAAFVWHERTRRETKAVLERIPMLSFAPVEDLFADAHRYDGELDTEAVEVVPDKSDRKFAALAAATGALLVSKDEDLLGVAHALPVEVLTARAAVRRLRDRVGA